MAPITPWIARLVETELEEVITWKSIKPDPDASKTNRSSRFSDDGSNLRSVVGSPPLDSDSTIQLLEKPGSNARAKIPVSDGDVSVLVILSDAAWEAYDKGIEEEGGDEPRKGDILLCKKLTVVSTTYGPSEERVKLRVEDVELTGNFRKVIGQPTSLLQRPSIVASCAEIGAIRRKQHDTDPMDEDDADEEEEEQGDEQSTENEITDNDHERPDHSDDAIQRDEEMTNEVTGDAGDAHHERPLEQATVDSHTSPAVPRTIADDPIESQFPSEAVLTQPPQHQRNPARRSRGGYSFGGREGIEPTRGDNLTGPQAPTLHQRRSPPMQPPKNRLLDAMSKMPGHVPRKRSPEPSALVSAQVQAVNEEIVVDTPKKAKRSSALSAAPTQTQAPRKRYRIPRDQRALLDSPSSWIPSAPGHEFPHPNVPIGLLRAWNNRATAGPNQSPSQPSPTSLVEQTPGARSVEEVHPGDEATAVENSDSGSDDAAMSEDEDEDEDQPLDWSQSQPRSQALPPDSSAAHTPTRATPSISKGSSSQKNPQQMPRPPRDSPRDVPSSGRGSITPKNGERNMPRWKQSVASQSPELTRQKSANNTPTSNRSEGDQRPLQRTTNQLPADSQPAAAVRKPSSSIHSRATPSVSKTPHHPLPSRPPSTGANARPVKTPDQRQTTTALRATQPIPTGPKNSQPLADNHRGHVRPSTQQTPDDRRRFTDPRSGIPSSASKSTPHNAPTGPRASMSSQYNVPSRRNSNSMPGANRPKSGEFYRPPPPGPQGDSREPADSGGSKRHPYASQAPNGTAASEMETAVPRALSTSNYHQQRSQHYRDAQRRHWLTSNVPRGQSIGLSVQSLLQRYRGAYPTDPVSDREFEKLIGELHPNAVLAERSHTPLTGSAQNGSGFGATHKHPRSTHHNQAEGSEHELAHSIESHPDGVFAEFVSRWKSVRPGNGNARAKDETIKRSLPRKLDVLSWGFNE